MTGKGFGERLTAASARSLIDIPPLFSMACFRSGRTRH